jgi:hypothetical protein
MPVYRRSQVTRQHLGAQTNAQERLLFPQRHFDPLDLAADELVWIIGAHRAAEDHRAGMVVHMGRQRIAVARPPDVQRIA